MQPTPRPFGSANVNQNGVNELLINLNDQYPESFNAIKGYMDSISKGGTQEDLANDFISDMADRYNNNEADLYDVAGMFNIFVEENVNRGRDADSPFYDLDKTFVNLEYPDVDDFGNFVVQANNINRDNSASVHNAVYDAADGQISVLTDAIDRVSSGAGSDLLESLDGLRGIVDNSRKTIKDSQKALTSIEKNDREHLKTEAKKLSKSQSKCKQNARHLLIAPFKNPMLLPLAPLFFAGAAISKLGSVIAGKCKKNLTKKLEHMTEKMADKTVKRSERLSDFYEKTTGVNLGKDKDGNKVKTLAGLNRQVLRNQGNRLNSLNSQVSANVGMANRRFNAVQGAVRQVDDNFNRVAQNRTNANAVSAHRNARPNVNVPKVDVRSIIDNISRSGNVVGTNANVSVASPKAPSVGIANQPNQGKRNSIGGM